MLAIHVLNAGKGDSIVLEHRSGNQNSFAVVDSNCAAGEQPPALKKLLSLGATDLSFVALTHPHADHYSGLSAVVDHFGPSNIGGIFTFPLESDRKRLGSLAKRYGAIAKDANVDLAVRRKCFDFIKFLLALRDHPNWHAPAGFDSTLAVSGFDDVSFKQTLPMARVKGRFFSGLDNGSLELESPHANDLTLAIAVEYKGVRILLGGDGTQGSWKEQARYAARAKQSLHSDVVKIPHHASKDDCDAIVLDVLFGESPTVANAPDTAKIALISAVGNSHHPSADVLNALLAKGIKPYCTNLSEICGSTAKFTDNVCFAGIEPALGRFVQSVAISKTKPIPCQGDITLEVSDTGQIRVTREFANACAFRGEYQGLAN